MGGRRRPSGILAIAMPKARRTPPHVAAMLGAADDADMSVM
jgi:hypothetical protein